MMKIMSRNKSILNANPNKGASIFTTTPKRLKAAMRTIAMSNMRKTWLIKIKMVYSLKANNIAGL
jgi:hypothetical protein